MQAKRKIRQELLAIRASISASSQRVAAAYAAAARLIEHSLFKDSEHIACYMAQTSEFDCKLIIGAIWQAKKNCYLPILSKDSPGALEFSRYQQNTSLRVNRYNILEPSATERVSLEQLDIVIMPLVGFDLLGHRLGMGGGYYDKTFQHVSKPFMLGLGYEAQKLPFIPAEPWDVSMDGVLTEERLYLF